MMGNVTVEILKAMLEAGLEKIKVMEAAMSPSAEEPTPEVEAKPKKTKKKAAASTPTTDSAETAEEKTAEEVKTAVESEGKEVTLEQIRAVLQEKRAQGKKDKFKGLFESFGVQRLPDVSPDQYAALLSAAEAL